MRVPRRFFLPLLAAACFAAISTVSRALLALRQANVQNTTSTKTGAVTTSRR